MCYAFRHTARDALLRTAPELLVKLVCKPNFVRGANRLFVTLQHHALNKNLFYVRVFILKCIVPCSLYIRYLNPLLLLSNNTEIISYIACISLIVSMNYILKIIYYLVCIRKASLPPIKLLIFVAIIAVICSECDMQQRV